MQDKPSRSNLFSLHIDTETNSGWSREPKRECRNDPSPLASWLYWRRTSALSFWRSGPSNSSASMTRFQIITDFSKNTIQLQITMFFWTQFVGTDTENQRMEIIELKDHPFFVAVQYHPEYLSRPLRPSPPYLGLILAATGKLQSFLAKVIILSKGNHS